MKTFRGFSGTRAIPLRIWRNTKSQTLNVKRFFFNHPLIVADDEQHSGIEKRYFALGKKTDGRRLFIVFTLRQETSRVISARDMSKKKRNIYEKQEDADSRIRE